MGNTRFWSYSEDELNSLDWTHYAIISMIMMSSIDWVCLSDLCKHYDVRTIRKYMKYLIEHHFVYSFNRGKVIKWKSWEDRLSYDKMYKLDWKFLEHLHSKFFTLSITEDQMNNEPIVITVSWSYPARIQISDKAYDYTPWIWLTRWWSAVITKWDFLRQLNKNKKWEIRARGIVDPDLKEIVKETIYDVKDIQSRRQFYENLNNVNNENMKKDTV